jgi:hypothetical protein
LPSRLLNTLSPCRHHDRSSLDAEFQTRLIKSLALTFYMRPECLIEENHLEERGIARLHSTEGAFDVAYESPEVYGGIGYPMIFRENVTSEMRGS